MFQTLLVSDAFKSCLGRCKRPCVKPRASNVDENLHSQRCALNGEPLFAAMFRGNNQ